MLDSEMDEGKNNVLVPATFDAPLPPQHELLSRRPVSQRVRRIKALQEVIFTKAAPGGMCGVGVCAYRAKTNGAMKVHKARIHAIDIVWHDCTELGCEYRAKAKGHLKRHRANVNDIGVTWQDCPEPNCSYKEKETSSIQKLISYVQDIGVTWHACTELRCEYKAKKESALKLHSASKMHASNPLYATKLAE